MHQLVITDDPAVNRFTDYWGNEVGWFMVNQAHTMLTIDSALTVKTAASQDNPLYTSKHSDWASIKDSISADMRLLDYAQPKVIAAQQQLHNILNDLKHSRDSIAFFIQRCSEYIFEQFTYQKGITSVETTLDEVLQLRSGVCQDFAQLLLQMLRMEGIPARYVSGYICPNKNGVRGAGATHAWVEVWLPGFGWAGIDPTNNVWVTDQHVVLAVGRHFDDCTPVKGTFKGPAGQELLVSVMVSFEDGSSFEDQTSVQLSKEHVVAKKEEPEGQQQQ
jgi:transglutaminase-like putative cysteine protease